MTKPMRSRVILGLVAAAIAAQIACNSRRSDDAVVSFREVAPILEARCLRCHAGSAPAGGWGAASFLDAIACNAAGAPVTAASDRSPSPLLAALERSDHAGLLGADERNTLAAWIASGAPGSAGGVHDPSFADPRSPASHGPFLRAKRYAPMLDPTSPDACGACHEGAPRSGMATRETITRAAPNAPACTTCHAEPEGVAACGTCHGSGARAYPPRDRCFFPGDPPDQAHRAHAESSASRAPGLPCTACHPTPSTGEPAGAHANGHVDVWLDYSIAGREARFDPSTHACTGTCHARGGARVSPTWFDDRPMTCNDCHASPPPDHPRGTCTSCHREANATGTALSNAVLHGNGRVDLGDGTGRCGSCHGQGEDPWPTSGAHRAHAAPVSAKPVACETCHVVPTSLRGHPAGTGTATVRLGALAVRGGRRASYDPTTKSCAGTYCHEGVGGASPVPRWTESLATSACTSCHSAPPPPPHAQGVTTCAGASCHEGSAIGLTFTPAGRAVHVDGVIDRGL